MSDAAAGEKPATPGKDVEKATDAPDTTSQNGSEKLPIGSREDFQKASPKLETEVIEIPEVGFSVMVREFTAGENARIKQISFDPKQGGVDVAWALMEIEQFTVAVIEPQFHKADVQKFHGTWPAGAFERVTGWVDERAGNNKEELRKSAGRAGESEE